MANEQVEALRRVSLFQGLGDRELERLARAMKERRYSAGETVTTEGHRGIGFFVIADGTATVTVHGEPHGTLRAGDHFGEIALIDEGARSATVAADTDLRCYGMTAWEFRPFVQEHPDVAWALLETLARRLRTAEQPASA